MCNLLLGNHQALHAITQDELRARCPIKNIRNLPPINRYDDLFVGSARIERIHAQIFPRNEPDNHHHERKGKRYQSRLLPPGHGLLVYVRILMRHGPAFAKNVSAASELAHHDLLLLQREEGRALICLDLLRIAHHEHNGNNKRDQPQHHAQRNDDTLVHL